MYRVVLRLGRLAFSANRAHLQQMDDDEELSAARALGQRVVAAAFGVVDAVVGVPVVATGQLLIGPSPEARVEAADAELVVERAHQLPHLASRVDAIDSSLQVLANRIADLYERDKTARLRALSLELRRLVEDGTVSSEEINEETTLQHALLESIRRSIDAISPRAIPFLVRLAATRPGAPDRPFRSLARAVADMSEREVEALVRLAKLLATYPPANANGRSSGLRVMAPPLEDDGTRVQVLCGGRVGLEDLGPRDELVATAATLLAHGAAGQASGLEPALDASILAIGGEWALALQAIGRGW